MLITSTKNKLVHHIYKLKHSKSYRYNCLLTVASGINVLQEALCYNIVDTVVVNADYKNMQFNQLTGVDIVYVTNKVFTHIDKSAVGVIVIIKVLLRDLCIEHKKDYIVLENIQDPGNLGTILRTCAAFKVPNIILSKCSVDAYHPKVINSSQGIQFALNVFTEVDILSFMKLYKGHKLAFGVKGDVLLQELDIPLDGSCFVFGNEGYGITNEVSKLADYNVRIRINELVDSINIATALAVCVFENDRQRG